MLIYDFYLLLKNPHLRTAALARWVLWILLTSLGWAAAGFSGLPVGRVLVVEGRAGVILSVAGNLGLLGALLGGLIGVSQWLGLRRWIRSSAWWITATALGWAAGIWIALVVNLLAGIGLSAVLYGVFIGGLLGVAQWLVLRRGCSQAWRWVWVSVIAVPTGMLVTGSIERLFLGRSDGAWGLVRWFSALSAGTGGLVVGLLSGITLIALLTLHRRPPSQR